MATKQKQLNKTVTNVSVHRWSCRRNSCIILVVFPLLLTKFHVATLLPKSWFMPRLIVSNLSRDDSKNSCYNHCSVRESQTGWTCVGKSRCHVAYRSTFCHREYAQSQMIIHDDYLDTVWTKTNERTKYSTTMPDSRKTKPSAKHACLSPRIICWSKGKIWLNTQSKSSAHEIQYKPVHCAGGGIASSRSERIIHKTWSSKNKILFYHDFFLIWATALVVCVNTCYIWMAHLDLMIHWVFVVSDNLNCAFWDWTTLINEDCTEDVFGLGYFMVEFFFFLCKQHFNKN